LEDFELEEWGWEVPLIKAEPRSPREGRGQGKGTNHEVKEVIDNA